MTENKTSKAYPPTAICFDLPRIALREFDLGGVLYHANYFHLYEWVREEFLEKNVMSCAELVAEHLLLPVVEAHQQFFKPISYGTELRIFFWTTDVRRISFCAHYEIYEKGVAKELPLHRAWTRHALAHMGSQGPKIIALPEKLRRALLDISSLA